MNELEVFKNEQFGEIRTIMKDNEPMFCLADVCKALDISHVTDVKDRLKKDGIATSEVIDRLGRAQNATFITEGNLYKVIFQSRKPEAEKFTDWVTEEVIPSIRKTGGYHLPQTYKEALQALLVAEEEKERLTATIQIQDSVIKEMQPKVTYVDLILRTTNTMPITSIAQDYGMSAKKLNKILASLGVQRKVGGQWILYQKYIGNGYVGTKTYQISDNVAKSNTEWTQKGRLFLYEFLKNEGILPVIESQSE